jgi:hypothetical protein
MSIFEAVLAKKADAEGATVPQGPVSGNIATFDQAIMDAKTKLNDLLGQYPDIDYAGKYMELQNQMQQQPVPEHPLDTPAEALKGVAFAFGAPNTAPGIMNKQVSRHEQATDQRFQDSNRLKMSLLEQSIGAEEKKGNFKMALKQADALDSLKRADEDRKRALDLKDWETKQKIKSTDAKTLLREKVQNIAASFNLDAKMKLKLMDIAGNFLRERMEQKGILGTPIEDIPSDEIISTFIPELERVAEALIKGTSTKPKVVEPIEEPEKPKSAYQLELERIRGSKPR